MVERKIADVVLRPKRQVTLPREICEELGITSGDVLELEVEDNILIARPRKTVALEALREIQEAFQRSGVSEAELLQAGRHMRNKVAVERYGTRK